MYQSNRLSRLSHPRTSPTAIALLAVVFGVFGAVASTLQPETANAAVTVDAATTLLNNWILCYWN
ncbi:MAG: hypothetical protein OES38_01575 [Gammaproteobacteria bacterium]|nr:hypothetical protein [Gammaproteobacteria bacterium]